GSSARSSSSVKLAAKISRVREKIPIPALRALLAPVGKSLSSFVPVCQKCRNTRKIAVFRWFFERNILPNGGKSHQLIGHGAGQSVRRAKPGLSRRRRAGQSCCAIESPRPGYR